jgi:hypothetical protein
MVACTACAHAHAFDTRDYASFMKPRAKYNPSKTLSLSVTTLG